MFSCLLAKIVFTHALPKIQSMLILRRATDSDVFSGLVEGLLLPRGISRGDDGGTGGDLHDSQAVVVSPILQVRQVLGSMDSVLDGISNPIGRS